MCISLPVLRHALSLCRQHLRARFPGKLWLDILSKADLLEEEFDEADSFLAAASAAAEDGGHAAPVDSLSAGKAPAAAASDAADAASGGSAGGGHATAEDVQSPVPVNESDASQAVDHKGRRKVWDSSGNAAGGGVGGSMTAAQMAAAMPHALRASATTGLGIEEMKVGVYLRLLLFLVHCDYSCIFVPVLASGF